MRRTLALLAALTTLGLVDAAAAEAKTTWLCKPGQANNPCEQGLSTTAFTGTGTEIGPVTGAAVKPVDMDLGNGKREKILDCFYVYPTVSGQPTPNATLAKDPEVLSIARFQAARYSQLCDVYAPVYRQATLTGISGQISDDTLLTAYNDVEAAWKEYRKRYAKGRGVVLIGHSQGTFHLTRLVQRQIDRKPEELRDLVAALLLGGNVTVKEGSDRGGSFQNVPACRKPGQIGCVVAFSAFDQPVPPDARFGRVGGRGFGTSEAGTEVLCTNPAALSGGSAPLDTIFPTEPFAPGTAIAAGISLLDLPLPTASTSWIEVRDGYEGTCSDADGADVLQIAPLGGAPVPKPSPDPTWGLHLMDANIALGDQLGLVKRSLRQWIKQYGGFGSAPVTKRKRKRQSASPRR